MKTKTKTITIKIETEVEIKIPNGYKFIKYDYPKKGELFCNNLGDIILASFDYDIIKYAIIEPEMFLRNVNIGQKFSFLSEQDKVYTRVYIHSPRYIGYMNDKFSVFLMDDLKNNLDCPVKLV